METFPFPNRQIKKKKESNERSCLPQKVIFRSIVLLLLSISFNTVGWKGKKHTAVIEPVILFLLLEDDCNRKPEGFFQEERKR